MGVYFNPSNASFRQAKNSRIYVDKTKLIEYLNDRLSTEDKCLAVSHARRFGKSHAAGMIDAYYIVLGVIRLSFLTGQRFLKVQIIKNI